MPAPSFDSALLARGTVLFQDGAGNLHVTVIVKATYTLRHGALAEPAPPLPLGDDVHHDGAGPNDGPRLEDPDRLIRSRADRPPPACFGPIAPGWPARSALLGSYDKSWQDERRSTARTSCRHRSRALAWTARA